MKLTRIALCAALALPSSVCFGQHYSQVNLVSSQGTKADTDLINPWGLSRGSGSPWWISDAGTGKSTLYTGDGTKLGLTVTIPGATAGSTGIPTGTIFNGTSSFMIGGSPALFLFSTINGTIAGWNQGTGTKAKTMVIGKKGSVYTGLTSSTVNGTTYIYAANLAKGTIDVFDGTWKPVKLPVDSYQGDPFFDDLLPAGYMPYNVQAIGSDIVVTYALVTSASQGFPVAGMGNGYVDIYSASGYLLQHLEHGDWLNEPWGVALAPTDFGKYSHDLLIGNFAGGEGNASTFSGTIAAYDLVTGHYEGELENAKGKWISIQGLWALSPGNSSPVNLDTDVIPGTGGKSNYGPAEMYFTAGSGGGHQGLFGFLVAAPGDLTEGNDQ